MIQQIDPNFVDRHSPFSRQYKNTLRDLTAVANMLLGMQTGPNMLIEMIPGSHLWLDALARADDPAMGFQFRIAINGPGGLDPIGQKDYLICHPVVYNHDRTLNVFTDVFVGVAKRRYMRQTLHDGVSMDKSTTATIETLTWYYDTTRGPYTVEGPNERIVEDGRDPVGQHVQVVLPSYDNANEGDAVITANIPDSGTGVLDHNGKPCIYQETEPRVWAMDNNRAGA